MHALLILLAGCGGTDDPELKFSEIRSWMLPPDGATLPAPRALAVGTHSAANVSPDELLAIDTAGRILVYDANGELLRQWRMPDTTAGRPEGICVLKDGRIAVADTHYHRVVFFDQQGKLLSTLGSEGKGPGQFIYPVALTEGHDGNLYVAEYGGNDRVQMFSPQGRFLRCFGSFGTGKGEFQRPSGIACGTSYHGGVYVADAFNNRILAFSSSPPKEGFRAELSAPKSKPLVLHFPYGMAAAGAGIHKGREFYVIEYGAGRLTRLRVDFCDHPVVWVSRFGSSGRGEGQFLTPWGVAVDSKGRVFVADTGNRRIVRLTP